MVVNNDHYINDVFHAPGDHELTVDRFDTDYVLVAARILVDPNDPDDLAAVHQLQDQMTLTARSARPFAMPDYDTASLDTTRDAVLTLARGRHGVRPRLRPQGRRRLAQAPPRHGVRVGRPPRAGGVLPQRRPRLPARRVPAHRRRRARRRVLVDLGVQRRRLLRSQRPQRLQRQQPHRPPPNADGSITVNFGGCGDDRPNCLPITDGWNYAVRLYRPRPEILDGTWTFPTAEPA